MIDKLNAKKNRSQNNNITVHLKRLDIGFNYVIMSYPYFLLTDILYFPMFGFDTTKKEEICQKLIPPNF